jgi:glycosyltransferase involved in cell wall biosynthesis
MPFLSCIVLSHEKPAFVGEALDSLLAQTFPDWEAVVFDSGSLYDRGFFGRLPAAQDARIRIVRSWETEAVRRTKTVASWCFNECFRKGLLRGAYVTYLCDDDLLYPNAFQAFHDHARANPGVLAMYASIDRTGVTARGETFPLPALLANEVKGSCCGGGPLDCHVDYLQLCHHTGLLPHFPDDEFWPEGRDAVRHADGIFLERLGGLVPIDPVPVKIGQNRKVPGSLNDGGERLECLRQLFLLEQEIDRLSREDGPSADHVEKLRRLQTDHRRLARLCKLEEEKEHLERAVSCLQAENRGLRQALAGGEGDGGSWGITKPVRYRVVDGLNRLFRRVPHLHRVVRGWLGG